MPRVFSLSIHADYACRHSGACCRAGWPIPIDRPLQERLDAARANGRLVMPLRDVTSDACVYYDPGRKAGRCAIHRQLGEDHTPPSCRHFPRIALLDRRGVSVTLSHYCPTAAAMLFRTDVALAITGSPRSFPPNTEYEGLDARDVLPPLLRPGMLWDLDGYSAWERHAVALLARDDLAPEHAIDLLARTAAAIERWSPRDGRLATHVARVFGACRAETSVESVWGPNRTTVTRYLAARLFASWVPYRSERLSALVEDLSRAHGVLLEEAARRGVSLLDAIRAADLRTVHARCQPAPHSARRARKGSSRVARRAGR